MPSAKRGMPRLLPGAVVHNGILGWGCQIPLIDLSKELTLG